MIKSVKQVETTTHSLLFPEQRALTSSDLVLYVKSQLMGAVLESWKVVGASIRKQGKEAAKTHRTRQIKHQQELGVFHSQEWMQLIRRQADRCAYFEGGHLHHPHLNSPA